MNRQEILKLINSEDYDFLRTNEHVKDSIILLTTGGSHAYGTNIETSDVDIRGIALNSERDLIGLSNFEQLIDNKTDTTIYSFGKIIPLLMACNPNTIEILGCKPEHYAVKNQVGTLLIDNRKMFLSKKAIKSFGGYATQQLRRLENAIARDKLPQDRKEKHILDSLFRVINSFDSRYSVLPEGSLNLYIDESKREGMNVEVFADINLKRYSAREFSGIISDINNTVRAYEKIGHRNNKKDDNHLNKHAMHLIRLYLMCIDIIEKEEIITYRENEREMLLSIRNGEFQLPDGTYRPEFFEMLSEYEKRLQYAAENTSLPEAPNFKEIEEFVMEVNRKIIKK